MAAEVKPFNVLPATLIRRSKHYAVDTAQSRSSVVAPALRDAVADSTTFTLPAAGAVQRG